MGPIEALELAKSKEIEAAHLYAKFSIEFPTAKEIFLFLKDEEEKHRLLIQEKIEELTRY